MVSIACVRACTRRRIDRCCGGRATRAAFVGARGLLLRLFACVAFVFDVVAEVDVELFVTGKRAQHVQTPSRLDVAVAVALTSGSVASTTCVARYQHDVFFWYQRQSGVAACCARQQYGGGIYVKKKFFFLLGHVRFLQQQTAVWTLTMAQPDLAGQYRMAFPVVSSSFVFSAFFLLT